MEQFINILIGLALLLFGRRLYWLFVGGAGFVFGALLANQWLGPDAGPWAFLIAVAFGLVGALISILAQRVLIGIGGFLAGGYLLHTLAFNAGYPAWAGIAFIVGGALGALLILAVFDWALIALSALTGATLVSQHVALEPALSGLLFLALLALGLVVQGRQLVHRRPEPSPETSEVTTVPR